MRHDKRQANQLRQVFFGPGFAKFAQASCFVKFGDTHVLCTATVEEKVPYFLKNSGSGWVTAEYGMLPTSTQQRMDREAAKGKQSGRTQEIQRLIGRSLRACVDLKALGERVIKIDCDVIQADGGTRTASICGAYVAMHQICTKLVSQKTIKEHPVRDFVAAISCGILDGKAVLDLDYIEDSSAEVDANFIMNGSGNIIEIQACAEKKAFTPEQFSEMFSLAKDGIEELIRLQGNALKI